MSEGKYEWHCEVESVISVSNDVWELHRYTDEDVGSAIWKKVGDSRGCFGADDIIDVMAYQPHAGDIVGVTMPIEYR